MYFLKHMLPLILLFILLILAVVVPKAYSNDINSYLNVTITRSITAKPIIKSQVVDEGSSSIGTTYPLTIIYFDTIYPQSRNFDNYQYRPTPIDTSIALRKRLWLSKPA